MTINEERVVLAIDEVKVALECLQDDFDGKGNGPSGLRSEAMAHLKQALLWLGTARPAMPTQGGT